MQQFKNWVLCATILLAFLCTGVAELWIRFLGWQDIKE